METIKTQGNFMSYEGESRRAAFALEEDLVLFEAAPDLLKALKDLLASLEYIDFEHLNKYLGNWLKKLSQKLHLSG